jgi:cellulose synthase/poly-beta-1,6-N-acetylglucosamine synthase-like glycosyltransferase
MLLQIVQLAIIGINYLALTYFALLNAAYLITSLFAFKALRRYSRRLNSLDVEELLRKAGAPPVTVLLPAYNEEAGCVESVRSLLHLNYPEFEVMVINDGSTDGTLERLKETYSLVPAMRAPTSELPTEGIRQIYRSRHQPRLWVIDKENGGKSDALNAGLNYCATPLFCAMDADGVIERDALIRLVRPFLENGETIAAGGIVRVLNGSEVRGGEVGQVMLPKSLLARFQVVEYLRAFLAGRMGWDALGVLLIISGAFGVFKRSLVVEAGGFSRDTVGEDMELVVRLHRIAREKKIPYRVTFVPDPVAWTEAPESLRTLGRQRDRWQRGLLQSLHTHRKMLFNPRYGRVGMVGYPYFYLLEGLGPVVEIFGYTAFIIAVAMGWVSTPFVIAFLALALVFGIAISVASVALEELVFRRYAKLSDFLQLFALAVVENFGYRQMLTFWRFRGVFARSGRSQVWGKHDRKGIGSGKPAAPRPEPAGTAAAR